MKNYVIVLSIVCIAVSIVVGSWFISKGLVANKQSHSIHMQNKRYTRLLTINQLASYLGISVDEAKNLGPIPDGPGQSSSIFPYIQIGKKVYFSKAAVDKWLLNNGNAIVNVNR